MSPNYPPDKLGTPTIDDMIDVYEDRVRGFLLEQARALAQRPNSELAVLQLVIGYFESHAVYLRGEDSAQKSKQFFKMGFLDVFGSAYSETPGFAITPRLLEDLAEKLYADARCGLSHDAMTRHRIMLSHRSKPPISILVNRVTNEVAGVVINPKKWVEEVEAHLKEYVTKLRDPRNTDLRQKFETVFECKNPPGRLVELPPEAINLFE